MAASVESFSSDAEDRSAFLASSESRKLKKESTNRELIGSWRASSLSGHKKGGDFDCGPLRNSAARITTALSALQRYTCGFRKSTVIILRSWIFVGGKL